jgi:hypothetical protein
MSRSSPPSGMPCVPRQRDATSRLMTLLGRWRLRSLVASQQPWMRFAGGNGPGRWALRTPQSWSLRRAATECMTWRIGTVSAGRMRTSSVRRSRGQSGGGEFPVDSAGLPLPGTPTVYVLFNRVGCVIYIGRSTNVKVRLRTHAREKPEASRWWVMVCADDSDMAVGEAALIRDHQPDLNIAGTNRRCAGSRV